MSDLEDSLCDICGAVVKDRDKHRWWHNNIKGELNQLHHSLEVVQIVIRRIVGADKE